MRFTEKHWNLTFFPKLLANCFEPLGIADGRIKDYQLSASSAFNNDFKTYGPQRARLNLTSWPPGYRSAPNSSESGWFKVELDHIMVITGIATQGYGDTSVDEWLLNYMLLYSQGEDYPFSDFRDTEGNPQVRSMLRLFLILHVYITNSQRDQLPIGLIA